MAIKRFCRKHNFLTQEKCDVCVYACVCVCVLVCMYKWCVVYAGQVSVESVGASGIEEAEEEETEKQDEASTKKPAMVGLPDDLTAMQIDCGTFHTGMENTM